MRFFAEDGDYDIKSQVFIVLIFFRENNFVMPCVIIMKAMTQVYGWIAKITIWHIAEPMIILLERPIQFGKKYINKIIRHINWQVFLFVVSRSSTWR